MSTMSRFMRRYSDWSGSHTNANPPDMPGREVAAGRPEDHRAPAGHVLAAVVADALDHRGRAGVAHAEALAHDTADEHLAVGRAVEDHVARDDVLLGHELRDARRAQHQRAAREALAEVVVGVALEPQRDAARHERAEALPGRAAERDVDRAVGQALAAPTPRQLGAEHRADRAVGVADLVRELAPAAPAVERLARVGDQLVVERVLEPVVLATRAEERLVVLVDGHRRGSARGRDRAPSSARARGGSRAAPRGRSPPRSMRKPERREVLAHLLGDELHEVHDELRLARELLAQLGVLGRDTDRARVEVADAHHDAAAHHERRGREAELLGAEQRRDHHVAAGLELAVDLHDDAVAQPVEQQRLLRLGEAELPRRARVLDRREPRRAGAAVVARDQHHVGVRLRHAGRDRADADLRHELHVHARLGCSRSSGRGSAA